MIRKGIVLTAGAGTRLGALTRAVNKQLLPVYDKPMVYYPIWTLMAAGIQDILIITAPQDNQVFQRLLGDGSAWGIQLTYDVQTSPRGIADGFLIAEDFIAGEPCALILGDNIFYSDNFAANVHRIATQHRTGATVFGAWVKDASAFGVAEFDAQGRVLGLEEKPTKPRSNYAVVGLYFYDTQVVEYAKQLTPSARGELEVTDLNKVYLQQNQLHLEKLEKDVIWLDTGTPESLFHASSVIREAQQHRGHVIACPSTLGSP